MAEVSLQRQFMGQAQLVRLLLWRIGDSTDIEACLGVAAEAGMLTADDIAFLRECLEVEESQRALRDAGKAVGAPVEASGNAAAEAVAGCEGSATLSIDEQLIVRLRRCADKLNRADAA